MKNLIRFCRSYLTIPGIGLRQKLNYVAQNDTVSETRRTNPSKQEPLIQW